MGLEMQLPDGGGGGAWAGGDPRARPGNLSHLREFKFNLKTFILMRVQMTVMYRTDARSLFLVSGM